MDRVEIRTFRGERWYWPTDDIGCWNTLQEEWDHPSIIMDYVDNNDVCIHAGANCGVYAKQYSNLFGRVYAVEPHPINFYCLVHNVCHPYVTKIQACLSDEEGFANIYTEDSTNWGGFQMVDGNDFWCMKMDSLPGRIGLIHLDVEGAEYKALKGGETIIKEHKPTIVLESIPNYNNSQATKFLLNLGYKIVGGIESQHCPNYHDTIYKYYD